MLRQSLVGIIVLLAALAAPVYGQDVQLKLKFKEGETFWVEDVTTNKQSINALGQAINSESKTTMITSYTVKKVTSTGIEMTMKIEDVNVVADGGLGGETSKIVEKTKGGTFTVTLAPNGKIAKFEGFADVAKKLTEGNDDMAKILKDFVTQDMFTNGLEQAFGFLPENAVKKGDTWSRDTKVPAGPLGDFKATNKYTYNGKVEGGDEIALKQSMEYVAPKGNILGGLAKVTKGDLKADKSTGTYVFDVEKGRLVSATMSMRMSGSLSIDIGGQQAMLELSMDTTGSIKVHSKNPAK